MNPPRRFTMGPLPEDHDELFTIWAWAKRRSKSALATHIVEARVEANEEAIMGFLRRAAERRGISVEEMKQLILKNPRFGWGETPGQEIDEEEPPAD